MLIIIVVLLITTYFPNTGLSSLNGNDNKQPVLGVFYDMKLYKNDLDGEVWAAVIGYEQFYDVSNMGRVRRVSGYRCRRTFIKKGVVNRYGYERMCLSKQGVVKIFSTHRLVCTAFISNVLNKPYINHINGIKSDNRAENLEWCTQSENIRHCFKIGTKHKGEKNSSAKYSDLEIANVRKDFLNHTGKFKSFHDKNPKFSYSYLYNIVNGKVRTP